ncbi:GH1 family beta-glucosidase [Rhodanobacter sp. DHG33]|uniref:GH1 family beta-glucosidase n=1 Tax=Rhodanobacter sp. DHG33 TaxID=2775921 RepID=UPI00177E099E|nr:GH1 family beta-glucosidase [Rhodanobacter sp. DHG33]MBD8899976.1 beta-glucosidase [Rhodanobacter sp. DHG33]
MNLFLSRRQFTKAVGGLVAACAVPLAPKTAAAAVGSPGAATARRAFSKGFVWGTATAAYQVEGAVRADGRGESIWDAYVHAPGRIADGSNADVADDDYHRYPEDIALMRGLGVGAYRFSVAWPRIFPDGTGKPNAKGVDFYKRLVDALHAANIEPYCTLYHWDLPEALQRKGGWQYRDTAKAFADYAGYMAGQLDGRVRHFMTMNEISTFIGNGYGSTAMAPGLGLKGQPLQQARHHALLGHGLAVQAIRATTSAKTRVGSAEGIDAPMPAFDAPEHVAAARKAAVEENAGYLTAMHTGRYTDLYLKTLGADAPKFTPEDMRIIGSKTDFQGLNIYTGNYYIAADNERGYEAVPYPGSYPRMQSSWIQFAPDALYWGPKLMAEALGIGDIYITENGTSSTAAPDAEGRVLDVDRVMFLRQYLGELQCGIADGAPVRGYFLWSLLDNFEWSRGYSERFGITWVDFATQKRTPKLSSQFYREVIARNAL